MSLNRHILASGSDGTNLWSHTYEHHGHEGSGGGNDDLGSGGDIQMVDLDYAVLEPEVGSAGTVH